MIVPSADAASSGVELKNSDVTPFASKKVGGGVWEYGTYKEGGIKTVYSYYWHPTKVHGASAQLGANTPARACAKKDKTARARVSGKTNATGYAYWNTTCKPK
ncbi:bacteriocin [Kroppenstedtia pulmonis]|uniref:Bacteriocin n=1 Tax=Kroppenstedtia pulmonis TaxID=1380685 RepID=A0A7D3XS15_9BACL|nr:lactococcin 972 family bacteriocin [Kroppenstedtia pulmonis]QKG84708.1 bacteriocin [Kroppenstedtia pulmonis]